MFCALKRASVRQEAQSCTTPQKMKRQLPGAALPRSETLHAAFKNKLSATKAAPAAGVSEALFQPANVSHLELAQQKVQSVVRHERRAQKSPVQP